MKNHPRILQVATGSIKPQDYAGAQIIDYGVYENIPQWWRKLEELFRVDIYLAIRARTITDRYDMILAHSEKVGVPLAMLGLNKPLVVHMHHPASRGRSKFLRSLGIVRRWAGVGYVTDADRDFITSFYKVPEDRLFGIAAAKLELFPPCPQAAGGPIVSIGVAKRDYTTLVTALESLPGFETEIHVSSRYGDLLKSRIRRPLPHWVHVSTHHLSDEDMPGCYSRSRFVVITLEHTTQYSAGTTVALEAASSSRAVIATRTPGMSSYVADGVTGILVPAYNVEGLQAAICGLWNDPGLALRMGQAGRRHVEANFNPRTVYPRTSAFMERIYAETVPSDG